MFKETKGDDISFELAFNLLLLHLFSQLTHQKESMERKPLWVGQINEILHESFTESLNLTELSKTLNIHPIHLSRGGTNISIVIWVNISEN